MKTVTLKELRSRQQIVWNWLYLQSNTLKLAVCFPSYDHRFPEGNMPVLFTVIHVTEHSAQHSLLIKVCF